MGKNVSLQLDFIFSTNPPASNAYQVAGVSIAAFSLFQPSVEASQGIECQTFLKGEL